MTCPRVLWHFSELLIKLKTLLSSGSIRELFVGNHVAISSKNGLTIFPLQHP